MTGLSRRRILVAALASVSVAVVTVAVAKPHLIYTLITQDTNVQGITPAEAHRAALAGDILLIDIRRPDEWAATGSGQGAYRVDLRRDDFVTVLSELTDGQPDTPITLICARGVRSARTANRLAEAGFTQIIDVPEGMLGSAAGPGWIARDLPLNMES